jgi:hypothetical protein
MKDMRKLLALPLVAVVACAGGTFKDQARDAMPSNSTMSMGSPPSSASASGTALVSNASTAGQPSEFAKMTAAVAVTFNVPTAFFLGLLQHVVEDSEPTSCDANSCTWGPGSDPLYPVSYKLVVARNADGFSFDWTLSGAIKPTTDFLVFASGNAKPGPQRHHGSGSFQIDFEQAALLSVWSDPQTPRPTGLLQINSYSNVGPAQLDVTYTGARDATNVGEFNNVVYLYANDATGGGDLQFAVHNTTTQDRFSAHSRWKNDGRGRADVELNPGAPASVSLSECWSAAPFNVVYFFSTLTVGSPPWAGPTSGTEAQCAYSAAEFSQKAAP